MCHYLKYALKCPATVFCLHCTKKLQQKEVAGYSNPNDLPPGGRALLVSRM